VRTQRGGHAASNAPRCRPTLLPPVPRRRRNRRRRSRHQQEIPHLQSHASLPFMVSDGRDHESGDRWRAWGCSESQRKMVEGGDAMAAPRGELFRGRFKRVATIGASMFAGSKALPQRRGGLSTTLPWELVTALKTANPSSAREDAGRDRDSAISAKRAYRRLRRRQHPHSRLIIDAIRRTVLPFLLGL
jgi:hypothetical protein